MEHEPRPAIWNALAAGVRTRLISPAFFLALAMVLAAMPALSGGREGKFDSLGQEIVELVRERFYDPKAAEVWAASHDHYSAKADSRESFVRITRSALEDLRTSHTGYYTPADPRHYGLLAIFREALGIRRVEYESIGADFTEDGFVRTIFAGGPAEKAGLRRGDRILKADGREFGPVLSFKGRAGREVTLTVERAAGGPPLEVAVTPRRIDPEKEWLEAQEAGSRLVQRDGIAVACVPLFSCAGEEYMEALQAAIGGKLRGAGALVLDFRDGWGGCNPDFVNLFNGAVPALSGIGRDGKEHVFDPRWRGPLVVLINGGTRSGKEVVAYAVKKHGLGTLVGKRTAGAVVGGSAFLLSDRSLLYLAVLDSRVDGERLEGAGVEPDIEVEDALPHAAGADPQMEKALETAAGAAVERAGNQGR